MVTSAVPLSVALYLSGTLMLLLLIVIVGYDVGTTLGTPEPHAVTPIATAKRIHNLAFIVNQYYFAAQNYKKKMIYANKIKDFFDLRG